MVWRAWERGSAGDRRGEEDSGASDDDVSVVAFSLCVAIVGDSQVAAEIVSDACQAMPVATPPRCGSAWLLGEVHRRAVTAVRERPVDGRRVEPDVARLLVEFGALDDRQRLAIALVYFAGLTVNSAAEQLGVPSHRALSLLESGLRRIGSDAPGPRAQTESAPRRRNRLAEALTLRGW